MFSCHSDNLIIHHPLNLGQHNSKFHNNYSTQILPPGAKAIERRSHPLTETGLTSLLPSTQFVSIEGLTKLNLVPIPKHIDDQHQAVLFHHHQKPVACFVRKELLCL